MMMELQADCAKVMHYALVDNTIVEFRSDNSIGLIGLHDYRYRSKKTDQISFLGFDYSTGCLMHLHDQKLILTMFEDYSNIADNAR